jgi:hypothetical protein
MDRQLVEGGFFAQGTQPGAEEGLLGLFQFLGASSDLILPMKALLVLKPQTGAQNLGAGLVKSRAGLAYLNDRG